MQHDYNLANASGSGFRQDLNNVLQSIASMNSGATAPATPSSHMLWMDTSNALIYYINIRNAGNTAWIPFFKYTVATGVISAMASDQTLGAPIASAATTTIGIHGAGDTIHITGTITITSLGVSTTGVKRTLIFDGVLTITHNATSLICPGGDNIITVAGSSIDVVCENGASGYWRVVRVTHSSISFNEISYLNGVTSAIQEQLNTKGESFFTKPFTGAPLFTKASVSTITIPIGTKVLVGAVLISVSGTAYTLSLNSVGVGALDTGAKAAGTDYYVYALEAGGFILSANATNPTGYTTANSRKIGGFHYGVIPEAFTAINNIVAADATKIAGINAYSFWDLKFRPANNDARGMFKANSGKWYDIYLLNVDHHTFGTSAAGKTIAGGTVLNGRNFPKIPLFYGGDGTTTYGTLTAFEAMEIGKAYGKDMISYEEFSAIAYGVLEATSAGAADTGVTQHLANFTSKFGMCMATGCQWIWGKDLSRGPGATYAWKANTEGRGSIYSDESGPVSAIFGGSRDSTVESGSRASTWGNYVWFTGWGNGCRYACNHLELA